MQPQRTRTGTQTLDPARHPEDEDTLDQFGHWSVSREGTAAQHPEADALLGAGLPARKRGVRALPKAAPKESATTRRRKLTQHALALRAEGASVNEIAAELGVSSATVTGWFTQHRREISTDDIGVLLDQIAAPLAAENLVHGLLAGDKQYTLETLKGRGHLRQKDQATAPPEPPPLRIVFEFPTAATLGADVSSVGVIHAQPALPPKAVQGTVIDAQPVGVGAPVAVGKPVDA